MKGPKFPKDTGSVEEETAARVRPQKLFSAKRITALFFGTPFTSYPHFLHLRDASCQQQEHWLPWWQNRAESSAEPNKHAMRMHSL
jgi:hypothetical protein